MFHLHASNSVYIGVCVCARACGIMYNVVHTCLVLLLHVCESDRAHTFWHSPSALLGLVEIIRICVVFLQSRGHFLLINSLNCGLTFPFLSPFFVVNLGKFFKFASQITLKSPSKSCGSLFNAEYPPGIFTVKMYPSYHRALIFGQ